MTKKSLNMLDKAQAKLVIFAGLSYVHISEDQIFCQLLPHQIFKHVIYFFFKIKLTNKMTICMENNILLYLNSLNITYNTCMLTSVWRT